MQTGTWIATGLAAIFAFLGLLAASRAMDEGFLIGGWLVAVLGVGYIFLTIRLHYDRRDRQHGGDQPGHAG